MNGWRSAAWEKLGLNRRAMCIATTSMMGNPKADLCGSWGDELPGLNADLAKLTAQLKEIFAENTPATKPFQDLMPGDFMRPSAGESVLEHTLIEKAPANHDLKVSIKVESAAGIKWVHLRYRSVNQRLDYATLEMKAKANSNEYEATVPGEQIPATWDFGMYYIEAMDQNGDGRIYPDLEKRTPYFVVRLQR